MSERWVDRGDGVLHCVNDQGEIIAVQKCGPQTRNRKTLEKASHHFILDGNGRKIWVPRGTDPDSLPRKIYPQSQVTWDHVCQLVMEGKTLTAIGKLEEFPPAYILWNWMAKSEDFRSQYEEAKRARAEYRADQAMSIADEEEIREKDAPGQRLRADIFKWGAEMDDRAKYGKQTKVVGDAGQPVVFQVTTGVPEAKPELPIPPKDLPPVASDAAKWVVSESTKEDGSE